MRDLVSSATRVAEVLFAPPSEHHDRDLVANVITLLLLALCFHFYHSLFPSRITLSGGVHTKCSFVRVRLDWSRDFWEFVETRNNYEGSRVQLLPSVSILGNPFPLSTEEKMGTWQWLVSNKCRTRGRAVLILMWYTLGEWDQIFIIIIIKLNHGSDEKSPVTWCRLTN